MRYISVTLLLLLSACATTNQTVDDEMFIFTQEVRDRLDENDISLSKIQFYVNNTILLERTVSSDSAAVTDGRVILENGVYKHRIVIPKDTPGILSEIKNQNEIFVSFESGNALLFSSSGTTEDEGYVLSPGNIGENYTVLYEGEIYTVKLGRTMKSQTTGKGYRVLPNTPGAEVQQNSGVSKYFDLVDRISEIKIVLKKSEFDEFNLETRTVDGLRVND